MMRKALLVCEALALTTALVVSAGAFSLSTVRADDLPVLPGTQGDCTGSDWSIISCSNARDGAIAQESSCLNTKEAECNRNGGWFYMSNPVVTDDGGYWLCTANASIHWSCQYPPPAGGDQ